MQLWTEEYRHDTLELLLSFPISTGHIVWAKFLAGMGLIVLALLCTLPIYFTAAYLGPVDHSAIWTAYIGSFLLGLTFFAVCTLCADNDKKFNFELFILIFYFVIFIWYWHSTIT